MKYDVVATVGTYEKDGQTKYLTQNVGQIFETAKGPRLKLKAWFNLAACKQDADGSVWLGLFEPKAKDDQPRAAAATAVAHEPFSDDPLPF